MTIVTKSGDDGDTGLLGRGRVGKDDPRIEAYGTVDELNASLGIVRASALPPDSDALLGRIQADLFVVGAALADPDPSGRFHRAVTNAMIEALEHSIDELESVLPPLTSFILPGGTMAAARLHLARTICRRAERRTVSLARHAGAAVPQQIIIYLNRLGDLLFQLARMVNHRAGQADIPWEGL